MIITSFSNEDNYDFALICKREKAIFVPYGEQEKPLNYENGYSFIIDGRIFSNYVKYFIKTFSIDLDDGKDFFFPILEVDTQNGRCIVLTPDMLQAPELEYLMTTPNYDGCFFDYIDNNLLRKAFLLFEKFKLFANIEAINNNDIKEAERLRKQFECFAKNCL